MSEIKKRLHTLTPVLAVTQVGIDLRIIVSNDMPDPGEWIERQLNDFSGIEISTVAPNIEDVFVMATRAGGTD